ncbi:MAG: Lsr2 family protein [Gordonia sp. (in: high G+C Gram-positive bacteria)]
MAQVETVQVIDDIDGQTLDTFVTIRWGVDGSLYEFDTSATHAQQFRETLAKYLEVSRVADVTPARGRRTSRSRGKAKTRDNQAIRAWAVAAGYEVSARGRIPAGVIDAYEAAH